MILPLKKETLVLACSPEEVLERLKYVTGKNTRNQQIERPITFVGNFGKMSFTISRFLRRPENFIPLIQGKIEPTSRGCIIFLRYTLQFSSRMFLVFWTITTLMFAVFLWYIHTRWQLGAISLIVLIFNIIFTRFSFHRQYKKSRKALIESLPALS